MEKEALIIILSFLLGYGLDNLLAAIQKKIPGKKGYLKVIIKRKRFHHVWLGYVLIIAGFFYSPVILVPAGIGIIAGHRVRDELFWFVEDVEKDVKKLERQIKGRKKLVRREQIRLKRQIQNDLKKLKKTLKQSLK